MIIYQKGDIFEGDYEALVNPVNCVGVMGKGLALQFRKRFPVECAKYIKTCNNGDMDLKKILFMGTNGLFIETDRLTNPKFIVFFPTKNNWREQSSIEVLKMNLAILHGWIRKSGIKSIAIPAIGCGCGQLEWKDVKPLIERMLRNLPNDVEIFVFEPLN